MHENEKLTEARHFLERMRQSTEPKTFQYELSAFLSAARSALQYACKEAKGKTGGQSWYDSAVSSAQLVKFFKEKHDLSVHETPVIPSNSVTINVPAVEISARLGPVEVATLESQSPLCETPVEDPGHKVTIWQPPVVTYEYSFKDWSGPTNAIGLCEQYLAELQTIVSDGVARSYLTG